jgi:hypothetical protein
MHIRSEVSTAVTNKNAVPGVLRLVAVVRTDLSEERIAFIMKVTRIGELGTTLAITSERSTRYYRR